MKKYILLSILLAGIFNFTSCKKEEEATTGEVKVTCTVENYGKIRGVSVSLYVAKTEEKIETLETNSDGVVIFKNVDPEFYYAEATYSDNSGFFYENESDDFRINAGDEKEVNIYLEKW